MNHAGISLRGALAFAFCAGPLCCGGKALLESQSIAGAAGANANVSASVGGFSDGISPVDAGLDAAPTPDSGGVDAGRNCVGFSACVVTAADVACSADSDCKTFLVPGCGSTVVIIGLNAESTVICDASPCTPDPYEEFEFQDCTGATTASFAAVHCLGGRCLTTNGGNFL